ncbi:MAG: kelch repeat-containing protein [Flavobacteriales bacterium]
MIVCADFKDCFDFSHDNNLPDGNERQYSSSFAYNGFGYVFGGICGSSCLNDIWKYNPLDDSWQSMTALPDS